MSSRSSGPLSTPQAIALGALHGPAELLPISSSAHVAVVPSLVGWDYGRLDDELRKSFEVALHAGTAAGLAIALRGELRYWLGVRRPALLALASAPPAIVGYALEGPIAAGLIAGAAALAWADRAPQTRGLAEAGAGDALLIGIAQACALMPGVSRGGATLAAARLRRFKRADASRLSRDAGLPVIAGATLLRAIRSRGRGLPSETVAPFAAGAGAAFASTLAAAQLIGRVERDGSLTPYVVYRTALALLLLARSARSGRMER